MLPALSWWTFYMVGQYPRDSYLSVCRMGLTRRGNARGQACGKGYFGFRRLRITGCRFRRLLMEKLRNLASVPFSLRKIYINHCLLSTEIFHLFLDKSGGFY